MNDWQSTWLGRRSLPRDLSGFEIEAFFTFSGNERRVIEERRTPALRLALALQIGFLRMSGRLLEAVRMVPPALWRHLGEQFAATAPDLASLRTMYRRRSTLFEHQEVACAVLGFRWLSDAQRRALKRVLREELARTSDRTRLLQFARRWLYEHRLIVPRERELRTMIAKAIRAHEVQLARGIVETVNPPLLARWRSTITEPRESGTTVQSWLWAAPAKHSSRQIEEVLERVELLRQLGVERHLRELSDAIVRRYARRLAARAAAVAARIAEPARTIEVACFLRYCLLVSTDRLLLMVRRRVADLWRMAAVGVDAKLTDWARLYQELLGELARLVSDSEVSNEAMREQLLSLIQAHRARRPRSRAEIVRARLIAGVRPVRALLKALARLPWQAVPAHPLLEPLGVLRGLYERDRHDLPVSLDLPVGRVWRAALKSPDRERAFAALEVATLLNLRRALRNGTVWIEHSLSFRSRETLFIPEPRWQQSRRAHYRRLSWPADPKDFLEPLIERAQAGVTAVAEAAAAGVLKIDDELHLTPLARARQLVTEKYR